jgi:hypothetical protein
MEFFYGYEFEFLYNEKDTILIKELQKVLNVKIRHSGLEFPEFKPTANEFKLKTDVSGGPKMRELITGVLDKNQSANILTTMLLWLQENAILNEKCSLHINISCNDKRFMFLNETLFRARINEDRIYELFPERKNNAYCRSVKRFYAKDFSIVSEITKTFLPIFLFPNSKYCGVNFLKREKGYLEFRYIGGAKYPKKIVEIVECIKIFQDTIKSVIETELLNKDVKTILYLLQQNAKLTDAYINYEKLKDLNTTLTIDLRINDMVTKTFYPTIKDRLFSLLASLHPTTEKPIVINYDTEASKLQLCNYEGAMESITDIEIINSTITQSDIYNCDLYNVKIDTSIVNLCNIYSGSQILNSKCDACYLSNEAKIENTFFGGVSAVLNGRANKSIIYGCKIGELANIDKASIQFKTVDIKAGYLVIGDTVIFKNKKQ